MNSYSIVSEKSSLCDACVQSKLNSNEDCELQKEFLKHLIVLQYCEPKLNSFLIYEIEEFNGDEVMKTYARILLRL